MIDSTPPRHEPTPPPAPPGGPSGGWSLRRDGWGRLVLKHDDGREFPGVHPARCFPLTEPDRWITLLDPDGQEVLQIPALSDLPDDVKNLLLAELSEREFVPVIQRIVAVDNDHPPCRWIVETNRGQASFLLDSEDHLRKLGPERLIITDSHGVRYEIPDRTSLDGASQKWLRKFL